MKKCTEETTSWTKMRVIDGDEYKLFSGPHGRRIVARLNKYMSRCFMLCCFCVTQSVVIAWLVYLMFDV